MFSYNHIETFELGEDELLDIKNHIFIGKSNTRELASLVIKENWGEDNVLLYKYLDNIWRCQLIDKSVRVFTHKNTDRLVFHTGLVNKYTKKDIYLMAIPNDSITSNQKWRVSRSNSTRYTNDSFVSRTDLMRLYGFGYDEIPKKTRFNKNKLDYDFHKDYQISVNFESRTDILTKRIFSYIENEEGIDCARVPKKDMMNILCESIDKSVLQLKKEPNLIGRQVFMERDIIKNEKHTIGYHVEFIIPVTICVNNKRIQFVLILRPLHDIKTYIGMSIIHSKMAYINARLLGPVNISWLNNKSNTNVMIKSNHRNILSRQNNCTFTVNNCTRIKNTCNIDSETKTDVITAVNTQSDILTQCLIKSFKMLDVPQTYGINVATINIINVGAVNVTDLFPFLYIATVLPMKLPSL